MWGKKLLHSHLFFLPQRTWYKDPDHTIQSTIVFHSYYTSILLNLQKPKVFYPPPKVFSPRWKIEKISFQSIIITSLHVLTRRRKKLTPDLPYLSLVNTNFEDQPLWSYPREKTIPTNFKNFGLNGFLSIRHTIWNLQCLWLFHDTRKFGRWDFVSFCFRNLSYVNTNFIPLI